MRREQVQRGEVVIDGRDFTAGPPSKRGLAMVFQSCALYPHMSVRENMSFRSGMHTHCFDAEGRALR